MRTPGFWPTLQQERLLRSALLDGTPALDAWAEWKANGGDIQSVDPGSQRMLGHVHRNLARHGLKDPNVDRLAGAYRHTWVRNQTRFHRLSGFLATLHEAGIPTLVLKGAALSSLHYRDAGLRPMDDLDVLVSARDAVRALGLAAAGGFGPSIRSPESLVATRHSIGLKDERGEGLDLHWHVLWQCFSDEDDDPFWAASVPVRVGTVETRSLGPTDLLLHVCAHGAMWNPVPPIRWVADAAMILGGSTIDWPRFVALSRLFQQTLPARATLSYLKRTFDLPIPGEALTELTATRASFAARLDFAVRQQPGGLTGSGASLFLSYHRWVRSRDALPGPASLLSYLQAAWNLPRKALVPREALLRLRQGLKQGRPPPGTFRGRA